MKIYKGYEIHRDGTIYNKDGSPKKLHCNSRGYYMVDIYDDGKKKRWFLHRLIAKLFIPNVKKYQVVNHIDGDKLNNDYKNLEWTTHSKNNKHAYKIGLKKPLSNPKFNAKLSRQEVRGIKEMLNDGKLNQVEIGKEFGVSKSVINKIKTGKTWRDVI